MGNEQRSILDLLDYFSKTIHLLSNYYGFGVVSYSNAVRDIVYGDTTASALTPVWYNSQKEMKREVHPGIIMHACTTYILLYYMWNMLLQACAVSGNDQATTLSYNSTKADLVTKAKWPQPIPKGLPPRLTSDLSLENISDLWRRDYTATTNTNISIRGDASCPFRWTVGVEKPLDLASLEKTSRDIFEPFLQKPTTWQLTQSDFGKGRFGWAHYIQNHTSKQQPLVLELPFEGIQSIGLFVARSIDPQWVNSTALVTIWDDQQRLIKKQIIAGYHPSTTSGKIIKRLISFAMTKNVYLEEIDLSPSNAKFVRFQLEHVSGFGFKFMGMIMCRYPIMGMQLPLSINNHLG